MRILVVGEGPTDCGRYKDNQWVDGPVQIYLRRLLPSADVITIDKNHIRRDRKSNSRQQRSIRGLKWHSIKAYYAAEIAKEQSCDCVAVYVDADKPEDNPKAEHSCRQRYQNIKQQIIDGLSAAHVEKQIAIVPLKMIESWMLGDPNAFPPIYQCQPNNRWFKKPELLWGDKSDPQSDYPKCVLNRVLKECHTTACQDEFVKIAKAQNLDTVKERCPISFSDFAAQVKTLL